MNITQIEAQVQQLVQGFNKDTFIYDLILAYGQPKSSVTRLKVGGLNRSKNADEIDWKTKLFYKAVSVQEDLDALFNVLKTHKTVLKDNPRFIVVTNFETLKAFDTKTSDGLDIPILDIAQHFDFFLPWAGMEKAQVQLENPADVKAAEKMGRLYAEIKKDNPEDSDTHGLNIFLSRLLFCFFAEDTGIFDTDQLFTLSVKNHTQQDGSDLNAYLDTLFVVLNTPPQYRHDLAAYLTAFPYVNGGLFQKTHQAPVFSSRSRKLLIECGELDWAAINPDIFGSMIQAVVTPEHRGGLGMHYTSVPNIMKVIEPLFLNDLYTAFDAARGSIKKLNDLLQRLWHVKIFDPACGSGNFLIIAYKELRKLEMLVFQELDVVNKSYSNPFSGIALTQFYGIEIDDFAHEIAILSLWLAEHQMNQVFFKTFGVVKPALPLMQTGTIAHGNATRLNWAEICPHTEGGEVFVLGNPPYRGFSQQDKSQKEDLFNLLGNTTKLDYISCWFIIAAKYILNSSSKAAFVSTNSICQGEQATLLWADVLKDNIEICFAYQSFKWANNAKDKAGVTCVIVGIRNISKESKYIFNGEHFQSVSNINSYLSSEQRTFVYKRTKPLSNLPLMVLGNMPYDTGILHFSVDEYDKLMVLYPEANKYLRKIVGSQEYINGFHRYCIWLQNNELEDALKIPFIKEKIEENRQTRILSIDDGVRKLASKPHQFREMRMAQTHSLILPGTSSERRHYIPVGYLNNDTVINNLAFAIYDPAIYVLSVVSSRMHMTWVRAVGGKLETRLRYSSVICYNNFPMPPLSIAQQKELESHVYRILEEREAHSEKTLAELYDPDKMPDGLRQAHRENDLAVERIYRPKPFESDEERLAYLFKLYEEMIAAEQTGGTLFESVKKGKKKS